MVAKVGSSRLSSLARIGKQTEMALEHQDIRKLLQLRRRFPDGADALILGDCQFHFTRGHLAELAPAAGIEVSNQVASLTDVAKALGFKGIDTVDLFGQPTIRFDLHGDFPPAELQAKYDWVIDAGTAYCCFNVAAVLKNMLAFLKPGGCIYQHASLAGHLGRGYYSFSPMLYFDFYTQNGFEVVETCVRVKPPRDARPAGPIARLMRFFEAPTVANEEWLTIAPRNFFVSSADRANIAFADRYHAPEPATLPNNSLVMCFAKRRTMSEFRNAIPGFFNT
jgi:hypothetical protein